MHDTLVAGVFDWLSSFPSSRARRFFLFPWQTFSFSLAHLFFCTFLSVPGRVGSCVLRFPNDIEREREKE